MSTTKPNEVKYYRLEETPSPEEFFRSGFYSAINYLNAWITALGANPGIEFNADTFNNFVERFVGPRLDNNAEVIDKNFFNNFKFHEDEIGVDDSDPSAYPPGSMPNGNPPPDHVMVSSLIIGIPKPGNNIRAADWLETRKL